MKYDYTKLRDLPPLVRTMCMNHGGWIVGGAAKYMVGLSKDKPRDWDVIIPIRCWTDAQHNIPYKTPSNTFGGFKIDNLIDVWAEDLDHFLATTHKREGLVAVQPRTQLVVTLGE